MQQTLEMPWLDCRSRYTYGELSRVMGETNHPHELWNGRLLMDPPPTWDHQRIVLHLAYTLASYAEPRRLGKVVTGPVAMVFSPRDFVEPDIAFILEENIHRVNKVIRGPADLAVEVVSPSGAHRDRVKKRALYEKFGVKEYWIVDPEQECVDVLWRSTNGNYQTAGHYLAADTARSVLLPRFRISLRRLFSAIDR